MGPLTLIISALSAGATAVSEDIVPQAVNEAYTALKDFILHRVASKTEVRDALQQVEKKPKSRARQEVLKEELEAAGVSGDESLRKQAQALLDLLKAHGFLSIAIYNAQQTGNGAIAQGPGAIAAGERSVVFQGDLQKSRIVTGNIIGNVYTGPATKDPAEALTIYRRVLAAGLRQLPLRGVDIGASDPKGGQGRMELDQVYVALDTITRIPIKEEAASRFAGLFHFKGMKKEASKEGLLSEQDETRTLSALEAAARNHRLVILGDPGSGKSTFINHLALCLAMNSIDPRENFLKRLPGWPEDSQDLIPIIIALRDFARFLPEEGKRAEPRHLWDFTSKRLRDQKLEFALKPLRAALEKGRAIIFLDGLDEIPKKEQRAFVREAVEAFANRYAKIRLVVTCRTLSYQKENQLEGLPVFALAPFDEKKIDQFIEAWYSELDRIGSVKKEQAVVMSKGLRDAVRRPDLWRMAPNPLLLTVMALVHTHKGCLPDTRALLYEDSVDILLWRWDQIRLGSCEEMPLIRKLLQEVKRTDVDLKRVLWRLAFEAHRQGGTDMDSLADIGELQLEKALAELHPEKSRDWAGKIIEAMKLRAGLLLERVPEIYTFPHRTFQEYMAGAHLTAQGDFVKQVVRILKEGPFWRQVILMALGKLVYLSGDIDKPLALVGELCPGKREDTPLAWHKAWLAGEALEEMGLNRAKDLVSGRELIERVQHRLADLLHTGALAPIERAAAGNVLARLEDPRFRPDAWYLLDEQLLGFVEIPAGPFLMGEGREQHKVNLPTFYISRYPVTIAQFKAFVDASGYKPKDPDCLQGQSNHPVVYVSWHDAIAYCQWLEKTLKEWKGTPEHLATLLRKKDKEGRTWHIILPSEAEWEKAARGTDGRKYPWGNKPDPNRANYDDTGIRTKSPVGCFSGGASPYGVEDMSGNVWEWTRSLWGKDFGRPDFGYPYHPSDGSESLSASDDILRVLRGGTFNCNGLDVRCAIRGRFIPDLRLWYLGFRVVASPYTSGL